MPHIVHVSVLCWIKIWTGDDLHKQNVPSNIQQAAIIDVDVEILVLVCAHSSKKWASQVTTTQKEYL